MRGGGGGGGVKAAVAKAQGHATTGMRWSCFIAAAFVGAALPETFLSNLINWLIGIVADVLGATINAFGGHVTNMPTIVHDLLFVGVLIALLADLIVDLTPNRFALIGAAILPTLAKAVPGKLGQDVTQMADTIMKSATQLCGTWIGSAAPLAIVAISGVIALVLARRVING